MVAAGRGALLAAAWVSACGAIHRRAPSDGAVANASRARTLVVRGHAASKVSAGWTGRVVYAVVPGAIPRSRDALASQMETWAERPARQGRYVAVGGSSSYPGERLGSSVLRSECTDDMAGVLCREAALLAEAAARGADWVYIVSEDSYVHTRNVEEWLADKNPDDAIAYGGLTGCGRGLFCQGVQAFDEGGGLCGGGGYILSRAALRSLLADGAAALHEIYDSSPWPNDMTTSCQLAKRGVRLGLGELGMRGIVTGPQGGPTINVADFESMAHTDGFLTTRYVRPPVMRWLHAEVEGTPDSVKKPLEELAFDHGCAFGMNDTHWNMEWMSCQGSLGGREPLDPERAARANLKPEEPSPFAR